MEILFNIQADCEATQTSIRDAALGERAIRGLGEILAETGMKATFAVIPPDMAAHAATYRDLESQGHEIGLHVHPNEQGFDEFLGVYGIDEQVRIVRQAMDAFAQGMGRDPECFTPGYCSANDHTFPALEAVGLKHGLVSMPTRNLPQCACVWGNSPRDAHYPHRHNRCLTGDVDFVDVPPTVDAESRMWGGAHPQDLRIELVDAKNHWYTIHKNVLRQLAAGDAIPVKYIKAVTHNIFDYSDPRNFRRETLLGVIAAARRICEEQGCRLVPATTAEIASAYRARVPIPGGGERLALDTRGRQPGIAS
ncbi:MAG: polysaccharide deacetylase family protein [Armatimonadetes bacterium]|nr:polysaccharide deacetylase family protein [Armatimonadota bacterium]